jgi:kinesin family protein 4/21/27
MRLQEVLKEREAEITVLETSLVAANAAISPQQEIKSPIVMNGDAAPPPYLSPNTLGQFEDIKKTMVNGHHHPEGSSDRSAAPSEPDESLDRLNELMLFVSILLSLLP